MLNEQELEAEVDQDTQRDKYLTFNLENEVYGIEIKFVTEIIGIQPITQVPELPDYIKGIINLRGKIIPVMDVRLRFKKEAKTYNERTCTIVVDIDNISLGLIVDTVSEVISIQEENIAVQHNVIKNHNNRYVKGIGKVKDDVILLLDSSKLLSDEELEQLESAV